MVDDCTGACCSTACLAGAKAGLALALTLEALAVIVLGRWLSKRSKVTHLANAFAGGVFLAAALVHIQAHAQSVLSGAHDDAHGGDDGHDHGASASGAEAASAADAADDHDGHDHDEDDGGDHDGHDHSRMLWLGRQETEDDHDDHSGHSEPFQTANVIALGTLLVLLFLETVVLPRFGGGHGHGHDEHDHESEKEKAVAEPGSTPSAGSDEDAAPAETAALADAEAGRAADAAAEPAAPKARFPSRPLLLAGVPMVGIALHSFIEAIAFGLSPSLSSAVALFTAVAAHRWIVAGAVLARLSSYKGLLRRQKWALFFAFVAVLPLGALLGGALSSLPGKVEGVLTAMSGGTFIYLGVESIFEEMWHKKWRVWKFIAVVVGVVFIVVIDVILRAAGVSH